MYLPSQYGEDPSNCNCAFSLQVNISCPTRVKPGWHLYFAKSPEKVIDKKVKLQETSQTEVYQKLRWEMKYINSVV